MQVITLTTCEFARRACLFTFATNLFFPEKSIENIIEVSPGIAGTYIGALGIAANKLFSKFPYPSGNCPFIKKSSYNCFYKACRF